MKSGVLQTSSLFLMSVLEGLVDGILIVQPQGDLVYANLPAQRICQALTNQVGAIPKEVRSLCDSLQESRDWFGNQPLVLESEIMIANHDRYRLRVQWLQLDTIADPCFLVRLEDQQQSWQSLAFSEAQRYGLTPREAEVWQLRRANLSRKEIAERLHITIDTVKKHLCNIQMKRQMEELEAC